MQKIKCVVSQRALKSTFFKYLVPIFFLSQAAKCIYFSDFSPLHTHTFSPSFLPGSVNRKVLKLFLEMAFHFLYYFFFVWSNRGRKTIFWIFRNLVVTKSCSKPVFRYSIVKYGTWRCLTSTLKKFTSATQKSNFNVHVFYFLLSDLL